MQRFTLVLLVVIATAGCSDTKKVADDPRVDTAVQLSELIEAGTGDCDDLAHPIATMFPGIERAMCTVAGHEITITVLTEDDASGQRGFTTVDTGSPVARLIGQNWVLVGHPDALADVRDAISGDLTDGPP